MRRYLANLVFVLTLVAGVQISAAVLVQSARKTDIVEVETLPTMESLSLA